MGTGHSGLGRESIKDKYRIGEVLGRGSFSTARDCFCLTSDQVFAVKVVRSDNDHTGQWSSCSMFRREVEFLRSLDHPNIVKFIGAYQDRTNLYIVTEKCTGGEVFDRLLKVKRFSEQEVVSVATQALRAISYIHSRNVIHRDIKAENFLYASPVKGNGPGVIKLIDFGLAVRLKSESDILTSVVGSAHYLAPEMVKQHYSKPVDLWSVGVMVYLMLYGRYPFDGNNDDIIISKIRKSNIEWNINGVDISYKARSFLQALLERDVTARLTADQALAHPFLSCSIAVPVLTVPEDRKPVALVPAPTLLESSSTGHPPSEDQYPAMSTDMEYYYSISDNRADLGRQKEEPRRPPAVDEQRGILRAIN